MSSFESYDAVIVGSGFGGTITALQLAQAFNRNKKGERVCILERGQWYISHDYPALQLQDYLQRKGKPFDYWAKPDNALGLPDLATKARTTNNPKGLYNIRMFKDVTVLNSSGVGGGSLIYANITIPPPNQVLDNWPIQFDKDSMNSLALKDNFNEALKFIGVNKIYTKKAGITKKPDESEMLDRTRLFKRAVEASKLGQWETVDLSIDELNENYFTVPEAERRKVENYCERQGRCVLGCIPGARHTLNKKIFSFNRERETLKDGEPIVIKELCEVVNIKPKDSGNDGYYIEYRDYKQGGKIGKILAKRLVLAAGSVGTTEILLKCREQDREALWNGLSPQIGKKFSTNGDYFGFIKPTKEHVNSGRGPIGSSHMMRYQDGRFIYSVEDSGIPKLVGTMIVGLVDVAKGAKFVMGWLKKILSWLGMVNYLEDFKSEAARAFITQPDPRTAVQLLNAVGLLLQRPEDIKGEDELLRDVFFFACMGLDRANGEILMRHGGLSIEWPNGQQHISNDPVFKAIEDGMRELAKHMIPEDAKLEKCFIPSREIFERKITIHPLGGCPMGEFPTGTAKDGVVDSYGRVYDTRKKSNLSSDRFYPNLHIADGSIIPTALGVNPSLTISALTLRIARHITSTLA